MRTSRKKKNFFLLFFFLVAGRRINQSCLSGVFGVYKEVNCENAVNKG